MNAMRRFGLVAAAVGLAVGLAGRADAGLILTGTSVTVVRGGTGTFSFAATNTGLNIVDFTNLTGSISSFVGDPSDNASAPFVINVFSVNPGATVNFPFQIVTNTNNLPDGPGDFGITGYNLAITGKDRVTGEIFNVSANSFITVLDPPTAVPEPSTLAEAALAGLAGIGYAWRRRQAA